jgi:hypothetical protein
VWIAGGVGLVIFYSLRLSRKQTNSSMAFIKWVGVILLIAYPATYISIDSSFILAQQLLNALTLPVLGFIKLYDLYVFNPQLMKKKFIVILSIQTVLILLLFIYVFTKSLEAKRLRNENYNLEKESWQLKVELNKLKNLNKDSSNLN